VTVNTRPPPVRFGSSGRAAGGDFEEQRRLEILLVDYEMAREDERTVVNASAAMFGAAVALLALLAAAVTQECRFGAQRASCVNVPDPILAAAPLLPLSLLGYMQLIGTVGTLRSYYVRGLEAELARYVATPLAALGHVMPMSYVGVVTELMSLRRGRVGYRMFASLILLSILVVFGGG
jgi:hypothetical protein